MKKFSEWNRSRGASILVCSGIFALMLALNILTPYICDDFTYRLNFLTKEPLGSFWEIFPSMYAHSYKMNGRLISHGLAQVFMLLPPVAFDVVNAAVFSLSLMLMLRLCGGRNALLLGGSFCLLWLVMPVFGQVVLWQVGAINYFWSLTAMLIFIAPELLRLLEGREVLKKKWHWAGFCAYGFLFGWYNEIASFVGICMVPCLFLLGLWLNKDRRQLHRLLPVAFAVLGYFVMLSMPAQTANKSGGLTIALITTRFQDCSTMLMDQCGSLLLLIILLNSWVPLAKVPLKKWLCADLLALAGICANYMPIAASYYPERCMCTTVLLLVMAIVLLSSELMKTKGFPIVAVCVTFLILLTIPHGLRGCRDIVSCHRQHVQREEIIAEALENGQRDVTANIVWPQTPWSGYWGVRDLVADPEDWPNHSMAQFYGLDSLIGQ